MLSLQKTPMQAIYESTALEIIRDLSASLAEDRPTGESFTMHNGIEKAVQEINFTPTIKDLMDKYHNRNIACETFMGQHVYKDLRDNIDIAKLGHLNISINEAIATVKGLVDQVGDSVYGALLMTKKGKAFNPFHPVVMAHILDDAAGVDRDVKKYTLAVYTFREGNDFKQVHPKLFKPTANYQDEIAGLIVSINNPSEYVVENSAFNVDIENDQFVLKYSEQKKHKTTGEKYKDSPTEGRNFIVPCQIINISGIAFPYYGAVYSKKGVAWNITPMMSSNVTRPEAGERSLENGSRICTHSGDSKTQIGLSALNHSNTTSPLNKFIFNTGAFSYGYTCLVSAIGLLVDGYEPELPVPEEKAMTYQEFVSASETSVTKKDYLEYIKGRFKKKMTPVMDEADLGEAALAEADLAAEMPIPAPAPRAPGHIAWTPDQRWERNDIVTYDGNTYIYNTNIASQNRANPRASGRWILANEQERETA